MPASKTRSTILSGTTVSICCRRRWWTRCSCRQTWNFLNKMHNFSINTLKENKYCLNFKNRLAYVFKYHKLERSQVIIRVINTVCVKKCKDLPISESLVSLLKTRPQNIKRCWTTATFTCSAMCSLSCSMLNYNDKWHSINLQSLLSNWFTNTQKNLCIQWPHELVKLTVSGTLNLWFCESNVLMVKSIILPVPEMKTILQKRNRFGESLMRRREEIKWEKNRVIYNSWILIGPIVHEIAKSVITSTSFSLVFNQYVMIMQLAQWNRPADAAGWRADGVFFRVCRLGWCF